MNVFETHLNDLIDYAYDGKKVLTKFLNFEEQSTFMNHKAKQLSFTLFGGFDTAERKRGLISYIEPEESLEEYEITILTAKYDKKFCAISHRQVLGTLMSLGLDRSYFGDISINDESITIFVLDEISEFVMENVPFITNQPMNWERSFSFIPSIDSCKTEKINIPSLRLDCIIAKVLNKSRTDANAIINDGNVLLNQVICTNISKNVNIGDIISIRHFGRVKLLEIINTSRKDRLNVLIEVKH